MTSFSTTDAAFEGFRVTRERPRALLVWAGFYLAINFLMPFLLVGLGGENLNALEAAAADPNVDTAQALKNVMALLPLYAVLIPIGLTVQSVMAAAVYRVVLRPEEKGFGFLRLGADELRLILLTITYALIAVGVIFGVALIAGLVAAAAAAVMGPAAGLAGLAIGIFALGMLLFGAVRLSLAPAITFAERRLSVLESWSMTRGQFWPMFATYALATCSVLVVVMLALVIFTAVTAIATGGDLKAVQNMTQPDMGSLGSYFTPRMIAYTAFGALLTAVYYAVVVAPAAVIYQRLKALRPSSLVEL